MTLNQVHRQQIYNIFVFVLLVLGFLVYAGCPKLYALQSNEKTQVVDYSKFDTKLTKTQADSLFQKALNEQNNDNKSDYLKQASVKYYILANIDKSDIYPCIQLARIYSIQKQDSLAKSFFYRALGLNYKDIDANYYFGEFYYERKNYKKALEYYQKSILYGKTKDEKILNKIGKIYERFGDFSKATIYYKEGIELNPKDNEITDKIKEFESIDYNKSEYYKRRLKN